MADAKELSGKSDYTLEEVLSNIRQINGSKKIKTSKENIKALKEGYQDYEKNSIILLNKVEKSVKRALWDIEELENDIKDIQSYEMKDFLEKTENNIEIIEKFLAKKEKYQDKEELKKLSSLLSQAKTIVYLEKELMSISSQNIIEEKTKNSLKLQIEENIFSEILKNYYNEKINKLVSFTEADEKGAESLESEYEKLEAEQNATLENPELADDFEESVENPTQVSNNFEESAESTTQVSKFSRFVKFSKEGLGKLIHGKLGKISRARIMLDELESKMNDKNVTSSELEQDLSKIENLLNSKKEILKSDKEDKEVQQKRLKDLKIKIAQLKAREQQEEKESKEKLAKEKERKELEEKNKKIIAQYNQIIANFEKNPNRNNYNVVLEKIKLNKDNKEIFENEEAYNAKLKEVEDLHNLFIQCIEDSLYKSLMDKPLNFETIDLLAEGKYSVDFNLDFGNIKHSYMLGLGKAISELGEEKSNIIFQKIDKKLKEFLENEIKEISKRDTEKGRELYAENLKRQILNRKHLLETEEALNEYLKRIEEAKNKSKTNDNSDNFAENDDKLEIEIQDKLKEIIDNPTYAEIRSLHNELEANKDNLTEAFRRDISRKLTELYENLVNKDFKQIEASPSVEAIEKLLDNMNLVNLYFPNSSEIKENLNKKLIKEEMKEKFTKLSINPTYTGIDSLYSELESSKDLDEKFITNMELKLTGMHQNLVNKDFKQIEASPSVEAIEKLLDNMNLVNLWFFNKLEIEEKLNQMKEQLNKKSSEDSAIKEILNDVENAMNLARNNPTKENIDKARNEITKYKPEVLSKGLNSQKNITAIYLQELDNLSRLSFKQNVFGNEHDYEQYDNIINAKTTSLDELYEKLGRIEYEIHLLEGQFIAPEQKENKIKKLNEQKEKIELEMSKIKEQISRYEKLKEDKKLKNNYYDEFFSGVSHLTDEQLAEGIKQNMSYEELAEISKNLEKAEKLTQSKPETTISKEDISESAYENIKKSISSALQARLSNPEEAKELIEKANSIFNQNYFVYSQNQREQLSDYLQTATNMIDSELYKNESKKL